MIEALRRDPRRHDTPARPLLTAREARLLLNTPPPPAPPPTCATL